MKILPLVSLVFLVASQCGAADDTAQLVEPLVGSVTSTIQGIMECIEDLKKTVFNLSKQTMLQQFAMEENLRTQGDSGIRVVRGGAKGLKNYESSTSIGGSVNAVHDHANLNSTLGMGETTVTMNGVYFKTRHNDYKLVRPSTTSTEYGATEEIPFPGVPPEVKGTLEEQIEEMREWFRAFQTQNKTLRDYPRYFKPVLCYLEGTWTQSERLEELFSSDRHHLEASSWEDLQEKIRFGAYSGVQNTRENWAYLPTAIMDMNKTTGEPIYAQWNYRILCHPINREMPLSTLVPMDDLSFRVANKRTTEQLLKGRAARFTVYDRSMSPTYNLLDKIFYTVPGMDNLPGDCQQLTFNNDGPMYHVTGGKVSTKPLNTCYYHRSYKFLKTGAMGLSTYPRGFNDRNMWVAQNHQEKVAPMGIKVCFKSNEKIAGGKRPTICEMRYNRFSYAIPLELVFLTPLLSWNPHNFTIHKERGLASGNGRNGVDAPFNGVDDARYYLTPNEFYKVDKGDPNDASPADTSGAIAKVKDPQGIIRKTRAAGTHIILNSIPGVGRVRLRYPISPVHGEGSSVWKELNALKDLIGKKDQEEEPSSVVFQMSWTVRDPPGEHTHDFMMSYQQFLDMRQGGATISVFTTVAVGHAHHLEVIYNSNKQMYQYTKCGDTTKCRDLHPYRVYLLTDNKYTTDF